MPHSLLKNPHRFTVGKKLPMRKVALSDRNVSSEFVYLVIELVEVFIRGKKGVSKVKSFVLTLGFVLHHSNFFFQTLLLFSI